MFLAVQRVPQAEKAAPVFGIDPGSLPEGVRRLRKIVESHGADTGQTPGRRVLRVQPGGGHRLLIGARESIFLMVERRERLMGLYRFGVRPGVGAENAESL